MTDQLLEAPENTINFQHPTPHVGFSLDPTLSQNPSNSTNSPIRSLLFDDVNNVSLLFTLPCGTTRFGPAYDL